MRPIIALLIAFILMSQVVDAQSGEHQRQGRPLRDASSSNRQQTHNRRRPAGGRKAERQNRRNQRNENEQSVITSQDELQSNENDSQYIPLDVNLQSSGDKQGRQATAGSNQIHEDNNSREGKHRKKPPPRPLIQLLIVVVIGLLVIVALLILKPLFLRRINREDPPAARLNVNLQQIIPTPPIAMNNLENQIIIEKQSKIEVIKDRFLNKNEGQSQEEEFGSSSKIEDPNLRLTPTFGGYTFRNNN